MNYLYPTIKDDIHFYSKNETEMLLHLFCMLKYLNFSIHFHALLKMYQNYIVFFSYFCTCSHILLSHLFSLTFYSTECNFSTRLYSMYHKYRECEYCVQELCCRPIFKQHTFLSHFPTIFSCYFSFTLFEHNF